MEGVDLRLFQFDYDQTWCAFFLNADRTIYGRYGTRASGAADEGTDVSVAGFEKALEGALEIHAAYPGNKASLLGKRGLGGKVNPMFPGLTAALPHIKAGKLRALAISASARSALLPDVPTVAESGFPAFNALQWYGLCAPAKTPRPAVERLNRALNAALSDPDLRARLKEHGAEGMPVSPDQFAEYIRGDVAKWTKVIQYAGIKAE